MSRVRLSGLLAVVVAASIVPNPLHGQAVRNRVGGTVGLSTSTIDPIVATEQGVGRRTFGLQLGLFTTFFETITFSADGDLALMKDNDKFSNSTTGGQKESGVAAMTFTVAAGLRTPLLPRGEGIAFSLGADYGKAWISGGRGIENCIGCDHEKLELGDGTFIEPRVSLFVNQRQGEVFIAYRKYADAAGMQSRILIGMAGGKWF